MDIQKLSNSFLGRMNPRLVTWAFKYLKAVPAVRRRVEKEFETLMKDIEEQVKPYRKTSITYAGMPEKGIEREDILKEMETLKEQEESRWKDGFASGAVYHGDEEHIRFLNQVYALNSQTNPLHSDIWPSISKYEGEIVSMTAGMLGGGKGNGPGDPEKQVCGVVSSGGTESILLAMKTYRDWARDKKRITRPEMIVPVTAHAAFDKASQYFKIRIKHIPVDENYRADVSAAREAITRNTIVMVGSAPSFPHGMVDPIEELSELARERSIGFHTDACLGGFVLPWAERLGYDVPPFDFRLPGVTSISADTHKYGYAAKGTSVILYRDLNLRRYQYFKATDWPGGLYFSATFAGSRPGALSAACWAALLSVGQEGYLEATRKILETGEKIKKTIRDIEDLFVLGDPLWVIAFGSKTLDIYRVMDYMAGKNWSLNGLHKPSCVHLCITLRHTRPGVAERFINDLRSAVAFVKEHPEEEGGMAPVYGLAATIPVRSIVGDLLERYIDALYKV
ncbi:MAG: aspartate aminotransferase family protein [Deltaproteobacteria bacterium]|nr:MAG: aspartate aminotransferase family protein [Desulfobacteraceae bacterium 4484_190.3]RLB19778.1 MAG: aspartate aminotransferase family protein [Deltaproteobacteria bacterium]